MDAGFRKKNTQVSKKKKIIENRQHKPTILKNIYDEICKALTRTESKSLAEGR
jgi:hypothetical protein